MKNNETIQIAALLALTAALLYRKYVKKNRTKDGGGIFMRGKSSLSPKSSDDNYEPYSKKDSTESK